MIKILSRYFCPALHGHVKIGCELFPRAQNITLHWASENTEGGGGGGGGKQKGTETGKLGKDRQRPVKLASYGLHYTRAV